MNEKIDLTKILKNCPNGWKFYSTIFGEVEFDKIKKDSEYPIVFVTSHGNNSDVTADGRYYVQYDGECTIFPSKDQRDWSKFSSPWYKNEKFDPKTLQPFDKVLVRDIVTDVWLCNLFSYIDENEDYPYISLGSVAYKQCIPYNDDTKHLVGTTEDAPDFYKYWED